MNIEELKKKYKQICELDDGNYMVSTKNQNEVVPVSYWEAHTDLGAVDGMEGNWGLVDKDGNIIVEPKYIYPFIECGDNYQVMLAHEYKIINGKKHIILLKHGLLDKKGNIIIPIKYLFMQAMDNTGTCFRVVDSKTYKSGVIDKNNNIVIPFIYEYIDLPDSESMIHTRYCSIYPDHIYQVKVRNNDVYGVYDLKLKKEIIEPKYKYLKIIDYNRFAIGEDYDSCNTLIDEKERIIKSNYNKENGNVKVMLLNCKSNILKPENPYIRIYDMDYPLGMDNVTNEDIVLLIYDNTKEIQDNFYINNFINKFKHKTLTICIIINKQDKVNQDEVEKITSLSDCYAMISKEDINNIPNIINALANIAFMDGLVNLDLEDVKSILENSGKVGIETAISKSNNRLDAVNQITTKMGESLSNSNKILIHVLSDSHITMFEINDIINAIRDKTKKDAYVIYGSSFTNEEEIYTQVTVIASGAI